MAKLADTEVMLRELIVRVAEQEQMLADISEKMEGIVNLHTHQFGLFQTIGECMENIENALGAIQAELGGPH